MNDDFDAAYHAVLALNPPEATHIIDGLLAKTRVLEWGAPGAPVSLCLPGGGDTAASWAVPARKLVAHRRVIAVDIPGDVGRSQVRELSSARNLSAWLDEVLSALAVDEVDLLAHSYGAMIAVACAVADRRRIRSLTLLDPTSVFARIRPTTGLRAIPLLAAPSPARQRSFKRWETDGRWPPIPEIGRLGDAAVDGAPRPRVFLPRRPTPAQLNELQALAGGVRAVFGTRSKYHDGAALADRVRRVYPWMTITTEDLAHHDFPFRYFSSDHG